MARTHFSKKLLGEIGGDFNLTGSPTLQDDRITRIKTGTYTGDGTLSQAITGIGFSPKMLWIGNRTDSTSYALHVSDTFPAGETFQRWYNYGSGFINSLDADGFTVDDNNADRDPNTNTKTYDYIALG